MNNNKVFCILPWIHTHVNTEGDVYPCCISWDAQRKARLGWVKDHTLEELFNSDFMKQLRLDMIAGKARADVCGNCYKREAGGFRSPRIGNNSEYKTSEIQKYIDDTSPDGFVEPLIKSWDIRFSNLCNLKCRSCGVLYSTTWAQEDKSQGIFKIQAIQDDAPDPLENQYSNVNKIYFAGGEPLIMHEHFRTLQELINRDKAKDVKIIYNSNITKLDYGKYNLLEYWKPFKQIVIGASIDAVGDRADYIRNGVPWATIESNLKRLMEFKKECNTFDFYYSPTISLMNAHHIGDMHQYLWNNGLMPHINAITFNLLLHPTHYDCRALTSEVKLKIIEKIKVHEAWLVDNHAQAPTIEQYSNLRSYLEQDVSDKELKTFYQKTIHLDSIRNESFPTTFPEYAEMFYKLKDQYGNN